MVRGWWPAIVSSHLPPKPNFTVQNERFARFYHLPWSRLVVCYCLIISCGQGLVASYCFITFATKTKFHSPKRTFRASLPPNFIEQSFQNERFLRGFLEISHKTSVSCEASSKFLRPSFQNERFARGFLKISQNKLPKRAFRARLPRNERFVRGFLQIS